MRGKVKPPAGSALFHCALLPQAAWGQGVERNTGILYDIRKRKWFIACSDWVNMKQINRDLQRSVIVYFVGRVVGNGVPFKLDR